MVDGVKYIGTFVLKIGELRHVHTTHRCILNCSLEHGRAKLRPRSNWSAS